MPVSEIQLRALVPAILSDTAPQARKSRRVRLGIGIGVSLTPLTAPDETRSRHGASWTRSGRSGDRAQLEARSALRADIQGVFAELLLDEAIHSAPKQLVWRRVDEFARSVSRQTSAKSVRPAQRRVERQDARAASRYWLAHPHSPQNFIPAAFSKLHAGHFIRRAPSRPARRGSERRSRERGDAPRGARARGFFRRRAASRLRRARDGRTVPRSSRRTRG